MTRTITAVKNAEVELIAVHQHSNGEISLMRQSYKYNVPDEELVKMTPNEALGLAMLLLKSAHQEILAAHPDKLR